MHRVRWEQDLLNVWGMMMLCGVELNHYGKERIVVNEILLCIF